MKLVAKIPIMTEEHKVTDKGTIVVRPRQIDRYRSIYSDRTKTLPRGGTFKSGVFKVTSGEHSSARVEPGDSVDMETKTILSNGKDYLTRKWSGPICPILEISHVTLDCNIGNYKRLRDLALTEAFAKLGKPKVELGTELGELKETLQMLRNPLKGLRDFLSKDNEYWSRALAQVIKNRKFPTRHLKLTGKTVSETWLEIRYGVMPFIRSIQSLVELSLDKTTVDYKAISTVGGKANDIITRPLSEPRYLVSSVPALKPAITGMCATTVVVRAKVYFRRKHTLSVSRQLGLDIVNVPEIMWQLTTCSFIVDWFTNVGKFISSWRYTPEIQVLGATVSYRCSARATRTFDWSNPFSSPQVSWIKKPRSSTAIGSCEFYRRTVVDAKPPMAPRFLVTSRLSIPKVIDLTFIAAQRILPLLRRVK